ncbi:JmjC domain-containing histone demethylation protein 1 [Wickerhamiella sorbophila]|uniref:JmjC domain-containing histone demethylation protein 1 n=1 Tax=Wickerhamiella sorbophila TaxID=45607 RepID=A0A2T0FI72_9ASCO|nr:JmjC domain-containing histone demethylation protein 1 [Wickerhamiella sorbophila]PRT54701.1 JmjC domain-containing histone demethylation protein 1 [Wickerhamiella sorbophila]
MGIKDEENDKKRDDEISKSAECCIVCETAEPDEWIQCDVCDKWSHMGCLSVSRLELRDFVEFYCQQCEPTHGPSVRRDSKRRNKLRLNYAALNNGIVQIENTHSHVQVFKSGMFEAAHFPEVSELSGVYETPVIARSENSSNLNMKMPSGLTPRKVAQIIGEDYPVPVMDVVTQNNLPGWTAGKWADYFETPEKNRDRVLNVISLEFSGTKLEGLVQRPAYVDKLDLVDKIWPVSETKKRPKVKYYCLMGTAGCFTDFHVDFGGTSVFYHVVSGQKSFAFIEPTSDNLLIYEKWCKSEAQATTLLSDLVDKCVVVNLFPGDTMIIPSGWIHAVYTPKDAVILGGNFLTLENLASQLRIEALEYRTNVPQRYTFPNFRKTVWYAAKYIAQNSDIYPGQPTIELSKLLKGYLFEREGCSLPKDIDTQEILSFLKV